MRDATNQIVPAADFVWENSRHGAGGWATMCVPSRNGSGNLMALMGCDTQGMRIKDVTNDPYTMVNALVSSNTPAGTIDVGDTLPSVYGADWAGTSNVNYYTVTPSKVFYFDGTSHVDKTPSGGITLAPGIGEYRQVQQKCASDPINGSVFAFFAGAAGWKYTLNGTVTTPTWVTPSWIPAPTVVPYSDQGTGLACSFGQIVWDTGSTRTGGGTDRYSIAYLSSHGNGVYNTADGLVTGGKISPTSPHALDYTNALLVRGGVLYALAGAAGRWSDSAANNLWKYNGTGTSWTQLTNADNQAFFGIVADPRSSTAFILTHMSGGFSYTNDLNTPSAYKPFFGTTDAGPLNQMKTRRRPFVANTYRNNGGYSAPGPMAIVGTFLYYMLGYGPVRTPIATFPTAGAQYVPNYNAVWPDWEEDTGGYEAIVGQSCFWQSNGLICNAQDVGTTVFHDTKSGHDATYSEFPGTTLTNGIGGSAGIDRNFGVVGSLKNGPNFGYTTNGRNYKKFPFQPNTNNTGPSGPGGAVVAGPNAASGWAMFFPTSGGVPEYTNDLGASAWKPLVFKRQDNSVVDVTYDYSGFHGAPYYCNHWPCIQDPNNPGTYYAINIGSKGSAGAAAYLWENYPDPGDAAGLYKMVVGVEPGVFRRVLTARLCPTGNHGYYNMYLNITADGHLIIMNNPVPGGPGGNYSTDVDLAALTVRTITVLDNISAITVGPPLYAGGPQGMWALSYYGAAFGLWLSFDRFQTAPWGPSGTPKNFNYRTPGGGGIGCIAAHPTIFGLLGAALNAGHARGRLKA